MKKMMVIGVLCLALGVPVFAFPGYGAEGAAEAVNPSIDMMLRFAVEDEYLARDEYAAIMNTYGAIRPFTNIKAAEDQHLGWLQEIFAARNTAFPSDVIAGRIGVPGNLTDAFSAGVTAEIDNIAMYASFLASPLLARPENADVRSVFERLMKASENHLRSFRTQLSR